VGDVGYSLAVPGHPRVIAPPAEAPRYDVLLKLDDAAVEIGLRVEEVGPTTVDRDELATTLVTTYGQARAADPAKAVGQHPGRRGRAAGSDAAAGATYLLRDDDDVMEFLLVTLRENAALYLTARFRRSQVSVFGWGSLRSILLNHQSWMPGTLPSLDARVAAVADVLCRDLDGIESLHDYRGWAWGCYSAADNRPGAGELSWRALSPAMGN